MARIVTGPIVDPDGTGISGATLRLKAKRNNYNAADGTVPDGYEYTTTTNGSGNFSISVAEGDYYVHLKITGSSDAWYYMGPISVSQTSPESSVALGQLIDSTRDLTQDWSVTGDWVTAVDVQALISGGSVPGDIPITSLGVGTLQDGQAVYNNGGSLDAYDVEGQTMMMNFFYGG